MEFYNSNDWRRFLNGSSISLLEMSPVFYKDMKPSVLPINAGVYVISENINNIEVPLYVGRTKNLRERIYTNHLMGGLSNARLKKYIISDELHPCYQNLSEAKNYIRNSCFVRWVFEDDYRRRGAIEGYLTAIIFPKYGIYEQH